MTAFAPFTAATTALVLMDYQPATLGFLPDPGALIGNATRAADHLRAAGGHVGFVRVAFTESDYERFPSRSLMGQRVKGNRPGLDEQSPTAAFHAAVDVRDGDWVLRKTRVGAFSTTELHATLRAAGIETLLLGGVHTSGAVLSTVREAHDLDYEVVVVADACADPEPEVHRFLVEDIFPRQARVVTTADLVAAYAVGG